MFEQSPRETTQRNAVKRLVARFVSAEERKRVRAALAGDALRQIDQTDVLAPEGLYSLAQRSLWLLLGSGAAYAALGVAARTAQHAGPLLGEGPPALRALVLFVANTTAYCAMIPVHEALHAGVIIALGGRPRFGLKLPFAAYCTAPGQLFTRNGYLAIALAPLLVLSAAGIVVTWRWPDVGACILLGLAGNVAGAVGDLDAAARLRRLPPSALIEDTETGYTAFAVDAPGS
jgi:hypothetical protein